MIDERLTLTDAELEAYRQATLHRHEWWWRPHASRKAAPHSTGRSRT